MYPSSPFSNLSCITYHSSLSSLTHPHLHFILPPFICHVSSHIFRISPPCFALFPVSLSLVSISPLHLPFVSHHSSLTFPLSPHASFLICMNPLAYFSSFISFFSLSLLSFHFTNVHLFSLIFPHLYKYFHFPLSYIFHVFHL